MTTLSLEERINRILNTSRVIYMEDMTIHEVDSVEALGEDLVFVNVGSGLLFQDTDVMTLDEACDAERGINYLKKTYKI